MPKSSKSPPRSTAALDPKGRAHWMLATIADLEEQYKETRNPVYVWEAIDRLHVAYRTLGQPMALPDWILGYLVKAALGISGARWLPDGDRHTPMPPTKNPDGTKTHYSDHFRGLTVSQRRDVVLESLGFKGSKGKNVLESARRAHAGAVRVAKMDALKAQGLTVKEALRELGDRALKVDDPARKIQRDRKKLRGQK
jgi:hypothetical protein